MRKILAVTIIFATVITVAGASSARAADSAAGIIGAVLGGGDRLYASSGEMQNLVKQIGCITEVREAVALKDGDSLLVGVKIYGVFDAADPSIRERVNAALAVAVPAGMDAVLTFDDLEVAKISELADHVNDRSVDTQALRGRFQYLLKTIKNSY